MRSLIYARYSSQLQNSRSIEDQIAVCRARADKEGWQIVDVFTDYAISGAAGIDEGARPGLNACLQRIEAGGIDQLLAESTDRLARHQGDAFAIRERITYAGARLFTLFDGEVDDITGTIKGLFDARFRKDLGERIKRGQRGTVGEGRSPAGLAYGYRKANRLDGNGNIIRGLREVDPDQAEIVRRIFREYAADISPRAIAERLNAEGVPGPRGGTWRASTIAGDRVRQNGILQNRLYAGVIVHNRTRKVVDPKSRRERIRPNPASEWISEKVPELRIIQEGEWAAVQERRRRHDGQRPETRRRPKHILSGLVFCGVCGGGWTSAGKDYWACGLHRDGRGCSNNRSIRQDTMEQRVLKALQEQMLHPDVVSAYVQEYHRDFARRSREIRASRSKLERQKADAETRIGRLVDAIAKGADIDEVKAALVGARGDRDAAAASLADLEALPVVPLHPAIASVYRQQVGELTAALAGSPESRLEVIPRIRTLIERVIMTPAEQARGVEITIEGRLAALLALATGAPLPAECSVAGERVKGIEPSS